MIQKQIVLRIMKFILGKKLEMSQKFKEDGTVVPVTLISAGPCKVTQIKTIEKDGVNAVQIGFDVVKKLNKPEAGHLKDLENFRHLVEIAVEKPGEYTRGQEIKVSVLAPGEKVQVVGTSRGMGFAGVVKRHHFRGHPATHGHKDQLRMPGSIGAGGVQRVFKGMRMGGRMGGENITIKNLEVIEVDEQNNVLALKGAVPGKRGATVLISQK
jgi:large subunit ribosomal protein L3